MAKHFLGAGALLALVLLTLSAPAEKVFLRDELTGAEVWRLTNCDAFHGYGNSFRPFSGDGQYICGILVRRRAFVVNLADGALTRLGTEEVSGDYPFFLFGRERPGVVYFSRTDDGLTVYRYWLDTGEEEVAAKLPPGVSYLHNAGEGLIGPASEYVPTCGDLNGDGLSDFGLQPIWKKGPPIVVLTSPTAGFYGKTVCPTPDRSLVGLTKVNCHPDIIKRANAGEDMPWSKAVADARLESFVVKVDFETLTAQLFPCQRVRFLTHEAFSGDSQLMARGSVAWRWGPGYAGIPFHLVDANYRIWGGNHYGTAGLDGRYLVADSGSDGMERLLMIDVWTGEVHSPVHTGTPTRPVRKIRQDHGHPGGSPDGTKAIFHGCYDLVNHRLYAVPAGDVAPAAATIPVQTTEGFAAAGRLLVRFGYTADDLVISYKRKDDTHFYDCDWGKNPAPRLKKAIGRDTIEKGSHVISDLAGRVFEDGRLRPLKEFMAVVRNPAPPQAPAIALEDGRVRIRWLPPSRCLETAGYAVYRQVGSGPPQRVNDTLNTACELVDASAPAADSVRYWVRAVERSGLYSDWSAPVGCEGGRITTAVLDTYDIPGTSYLEPGQKPEHDRRTVTFHVPAAGTHTLWTRCRAPYGEETFDLALAGKDIGTMAVTEPEWHWARIGSWQLPAGRHTLTLARSVTYDIDSRNLIANPGFEDGVTGWEAPEGITSLGTENPHSGANCIKMSGDLTSKHLVQKVAFEPKPNRHYRLSYWLRAVFTKAGSSSRFYNDHPHTSGAIWVDAQPMTDPFDLTIYGDRFHETEWRQIVREVRARPGVKIKAVNVRPFLSHWNWGEQQGTVWIDDVEFHELGPRQRPVKATRLLVTNVDGYIPAGRNGRSAYAFPKMPVVAVTGLRHSDVTGNTVTLAWDPGRAGTRGYNIYARAGNTCPATKYFRKTTVWNTHTAVLQGLKHSSAYTIKVAALNEDGGEGDPAVLQVRTANTAPDTYSATAADMPARAPLCRKTEAGVTYLVTPKDPKDRLALCDLKAEGLPTGSCKFELDVRKAGEYRIWGRLWAADGGSNSFYFSLDGADEMQWSVPGWAMGTWNWLEPVAGKQWRLGPGKHTIVMRTRESGTRLARLVVTSDPSPEPPAE